MKAAIVTAAGNPPVYGDFREPLAASGAAVVTVAASALSHVTKSRAAGTHYSGGADFPFVPGVDGVGRLPDGRRVYFLMPEAPFGGLAERTLVDPSRCVPLPDGLDDVTAAALAIPGMSSWAALTERAGFTAGETVLVNGATGASGRLAVQIARHLGAGKIIATGRNPEALAELPALGADIVIPLAEDADALEAAFLPVFRDRVDIVLDYLWGPSAERLLIAAARAGEETVPIRFVQIGSASARNITLPSAVLRATALQLLGSGTGSVPPDRIVHAIGQLMQAALPAGLRIATQQVPLAGVANAWADEGGARTVFTIA